jgi:hypothetical protein
MGRATQLAKVRVLDKYLVQGVVEHGKQLVIWMMMFLIRSYAIF